MLTKNGKRLLNSLPVIFYSNNATFAVPTVRFAVSAAAIIEVKDINGDTRYCTNTSNSGNTSIITSALSTQSANPSSGVAIGSGSTPATENDYTLENQITGITASGPSETYEFDTENNTITYHWDYVITNNTGADITIREVGRFISTYSNATRGQNASSASANKLCVMLDRTVLDTPLTIPNGEARTLRYSTVCDIS